MSAASPPFKPDRPARGLRSLFGRPAATPASAPLVAPSKVTGLAPPSQSPPATFDASAPLGDHLWGTGLATPGGAEAIMRLAALLPLSPETTLLLVGRGAAAAGNVITEARGAWVAAHDTLAEPAPPPAPVTIGPRQPPKRVEAARWAPNAPSFRQGRQNHALLLEPFRDGSAPPRLLPAVAAALRPGAQIVLFDLVARDGATSDPGHSRWLRMERRGSPPSERAAVAAFTAAGFQTHVVQDEGAAHAAAVIQGWSKLLRALSEAPTRPSRAQAAALVAEAEAWLLRLKLIESGALRLLRWHGSLR